MYIYIYIYIHKYTYVIPNILQFCTRVMWNDNYNTIK